MIAVEHCDLPRTRHHRDLSMDITWGQELLRSFYDRQKSSRAAAMVSDKGHHSGVCYPIKSGISGQLHRAKGSGSCTDRARTMLAIQESGARN